MSQAVCGICRLALFSKDVRTDALKCGHVIHRSCLLGIQNGLCPYCRKKIEDSIELFIDFEASDEEARLSEVLPILQSMQTQMDAAISILHARGVSLPPPQPTPPTHQNLRQNQAENHWNRDQNAIPMSRPGQEWSSRQEFIVQVPLPWQNIRGQPRMHFEVVNNQLMVRLSRHRR